MPKTSDTNNLPAKKKRHYRSFTFEEKTEMYLCAQNKISDIEIMNKFNCEEDVLIDCINDIFVFNQKSLGYSEVFAYR